MPGLQIEECPPLDEYPTVPEFNEALGGGAVALYVLSAVVIVILALQYGFLCAHFMRHVPDSRKVCEILGLLYNVY